MKKFSTKVLLLTLIAVFYPISAFASGGDLIHQMTSLVFQIGIIIFAARLGGMLFGKLKIPSVLGELFAGIIIGPYLLGGFSFAGFEHGLFPLASGGTFPVSPELYGIAVIASIILLFIAGLETDLAMFIRCSIAGTLVGVGGVVASFVIGAYTGIYFLDAPFMDIRCLFLGAMSTATSVGITARILSERRRMDSPEGVTILAGAVIDDVLGIIILAIILGIAAVTQSGEGAVEWGKIHAIAIKAVVVWLGFTALGLIFAYKVSSFLKAFKSVTVLSVLALGLALILAGIFEKAGLAMIIGAYVMGLSLSKTDLSYVLQENLHPLYTFFVPIFFTVMGMLVNVKVFFSKEILIFGLVYTIGAVLAKIMGSGIPTLFVKFNKLGALRVGLGMVPRGEVALIIAGIGLSHGVLDETIFGVSIMMTLLTTVIAPPLLNVTLKNPARGTKKEFITSDTIHTIYKFPTPELTSFLMGKIRSYLESDGFFIHLIKVDCDMYQIRKDKIMISLYHHPQKIIFDTLGEDVPFIKTIVYESLLGLHSTVNKLKNFAKPQEMRKELIGSGGRKDIKIAKLLDVKCILMDIKSDTKEGVIKELVDILAANGKIADKEQVLEDLWDREVSMSTGMEHGIAIPHAKSDGIKKMVVAVGFKRGVGVDFQAIDELPSNLFIMVLSPKHTTGPHIQFLATIGTILSSNEARTTLLGCKSSRDVWNYLTKKKKA